MISRRRFLAALALLAPVPARAQPAKPLTAVWRTDIDGDRRAETFTYTLAERGPRFVATLSIRSDKAVLWSHRWEMAASDFTGDLLREEGDITPQQWVQGFFHGGTLYGARLERRRLRADELDPGLIDPVAQRQKMPAASLEKALLSDRAHVVLNYRATWREDVWRIVYVPELKRFIRFSSGPY
jgi:hypothetical protein